MRHPCMTFWPEKFFADTAHIPGDAANAYLALIGHAWIRGGSLPDDDDALRLMARVEARRWGRIKHLILAFWHVGEDGRLHQKRIDQEWERAGHKHRAAPQHIPKSGNTLNQNLQL